MRSGPPPDPNALRRDRGNDAEWTVLPAEGRAGDPPAWPLTRASTRETALWVELWAKPQAVEWDRLGQQREVALYVRRLGEAEKPNSRVTLTTVVRQMADALGITIAGMRANRWKIGTVAAAAGDAKTKSAKSAPARRSARSMFQVIDGSGEAS